VLAAMVFMAIVIPVTVDAVRVANVAAQVADRKATAARIAERVMNELIVTGQLQQASQTGVAEEGRQRYEWNMRTEPWNEGALRLLTVQVIFIVQGRDYDVRISTVVDTSVQ
jgi:CxxC motif-containing protein (DUF1111 family)